MLKFSLKQLEVFVAVAELNSFTGAAKELYLTQSTVSAHISGLEDALKTRLFTRDTRRSVQLTPQGQRLYPAAKRILSDCRELDSLVENRHEDLPLLLGASTLPGQYLLPALLASFLRRCPDSRYLLKRGDSQQIHALLRSGSVRIGFVGAQLDPARLRYFPLLEDRLVMVTPNTPYYREKAKQGVYGRDLLDEPTIAREEGSGTDSTVAAYMRRMEHDVSRLKIVARVDNPETIKSMAAHGAGVSVLSALAVRGEVEQGRLLAFEMDPAGLRRQIYAAVKKDETYTDLEQRFLRFCRGFFKIQSDIE